MADTPEIPPALTPSEWTAWVNDDDANQLGYGRYELQHQPDVTVHEVRNYADGITCNNGYHDEEFSPNARDRHALAALCLYQQSFGFDAEDVELLRDLAEYVDNPLSVDINTGAEEVARLLFLASRIAALLPAPSRSPLEGP